MAQLIFFVRFLSHQQSDLMWKRLAILAINWVIYARHNLDKCQNTLVSDTKNFKAFSQTPDGFKLDFNDIKHDETDCTQEIYGS